LTPSSMNPPGGIHMHKCFWVLLFLLFVRPYRSQVWDSCTVANHCTEHRPGSMTADGRDHQSTR
jgi:hypothetical protein